MNRGWNDHDRERKWHNIDLYHDLRDKVRECDRYVTSHDRVESLESNTVDPKNFKIEDMLARIFIRAEGTNKRTSLNYRDSGQHSIVITVAMSLLS